MQHDPHNTIYRRDLSVVLSKTGDARQALGELDKALQAYRSSLAIADYLAALDPTNAEWQRDLSISHNRVGDLLLAKGDATAAAAEYQAGFTVAEALLDADPQNVQRILDVAYSRYKLAMAGIDRQANLDRGARRDGRAQGRRPAAAGLRELGDDGGRCAEGCTIAVGLRGQFTFLPESRPHWSACARGKKQTAPCAPPPRLSGKDSPQRLRVYSRHVLVTRAIPKDRPFERSRERRRIRRRNVVTVAEGQLAVDHGVTARGVAEQVGQVDIARIADIRR